MATAPDIFSSDKGSGLLTVFNSSLVLLLALVRGHIPHRSNHRHPHESHWMFARRCPWVSTFLEMLCFQMLPVLPKEDIDCAQQGFVHAKGFAKWKQTQASVECRSHLHNCLVSKGNRGTTYITRSVGSAHSSIKQVAWQKSLAASFQVCCQFSELSWSTMWTSQCWLKQSPSGQLQYLFECNWM